MLKVPLDRLPPVVRLRPRPDDAPYGDACAKAMLGDWGPTAAVLRVVLLDHLRGG